MPRLIYGLGIANVGVANAKVICKAFAYDLENLPYEHIRWIENKDEVDVDNLTGTSDMKKIIDMKGNPLLLFVNAWSVGMVLDRNEGLVLAEFGTN